MNDPSTPGTSPDLSAQAPREALLRAYFEKRANLVRFFAGRSGQGVAEDLAQELYVKIAAKVAAGQDDEEIKSPVAMLYRMASNLALDTARGARRATARDTTWRTESRPTIGAEEVSQDVAADESLIARDRVRQLTEAVADLPPQMGRAFRLHKLEGRSQAETAQAMGVSVKAIEKHIAAAMKTLTARLRS